MAVGDVKAFQENASGSFDEIALAYTDVGGLVIELDKKANSQLSVLTKRGDYTLVSSDAGKYIRVDSVTGVVVTIPYSLIVEFFDEGDWVEVEQAGAGQVRVSATLGATILGDAKTGGQNQSIRILCLGSDTYVIKDGVA